MPEANVKVRKLNSENIDSKHALGLCKLRMKTLNTKKSRSIYVIKFNIEFFVNKRTKRLIENVATSKEICKNINKNIIEAAEKAISDKREETELKKKYSRRKVEAHIRLLENKIP